jgi:hypothetical protein
MGKHPVEGTNLWLSTSNKSFDIRRPNSRAMEKGVMSRLRYNNNVAALRSPRLSRHRLAVVRERGVDGVTVREIAQRQGKKSRVVIIFRHQEPWCARSSQMARIIDERRNTLLDRIDADGGSCSVREIVDDHLPSLEPFNDNGDDCYMRFTVMLNMTHRDLFVARWAT